MRFNSIEFLFFFPLVVFLYFILPHRLRWILLLIASCIFYMFLIPVYILILFLIIGIDYCAGRAIEGAVGERRKIYLLLSLSANIGLLCFFKYYDFFVATTDQIFHLHQNPSYAFLFRQVILPVGLSFHTFQAMSYTVEIYRGAQKAERHLGIYALYVLFFPQLVAGPIERPQQLLPQFYEKHSFQYDQVKSGLRLMAWGLIKKVVIADRLATIVQPIFETPHKFNSLALALGVFFFAFQIFCDFSGYSDIAVGAARIMGFQLIQNFRYPYHARSLKAFWSRWHISLSTWFRDYVYIPLGGRKVAASKWYFNIMCVFVLSGIWHGAQVTFLAWGIFHGLCFIAEQAARKTVLYKFWYALKGRYTKMISVIQPIMVFGVVSLGWAIFRANSLSDAIYILSKLPFVFMDLWEAVIHKNGVLGLPLVSRFSVLFCFALIFFLETVHYFQKKTDFNLIIERQPLYVRWGLYYLGALAITYSGIIENFKFIYFQF
jgi:alginate O-acetyltransferase complex protein AlgI